MTLMSSCACGLDVHAHVVPEAIPSYFGGRTPSHWPAMADAQACHKHVMVSGRVYRTVPDRCWDVSKRIADMDRMGIRMQALSPMPELLSYWMDAEPAADLLRYINDQIAELVVRGHGRFVGLGAVPLQTVETAIAELHRCVDDLGFAGIEIGSNVNGRVIGDPELDPFFAAAEQLDAAIFVHALRPAGMDRLVGPGQLQQVLAYPTDVGLAAASVITSGLLSRRPGLRLAFSHGGGTLGSLLPRLQEGWTIFPALSETIAEAPAAQAKRFFYDALVYDDATLAHLVSLFGASQLMLGTDYPFAFHERDPVGRIGSVFAEGEIRDMLVHRNAERFLGLSEVNT